MWCVPKRRRRRGRGKGKQGKQKQSRKWETPVVELETNAGHLEKIPQQRDFRNLGVEVHNLQLTNTTVVSKVWVNLGSGSQRGREVETESKRGRQGEREKDREADGQYFSVQNPSGVSTAGLLQANVEPHWSTHSWKHLRAKMTLWLRVKHSFSCTMCWNFSTSSWKAEQSRLGCLSQSGSRFQLLSLRWAAKCSVLFLVCVELWATKANSGWE